LNGSEYRVSESNFNHAWSFSPGVSLFVDCESDAEIQELFKALSSNGGQVMISLDKYESGGYGNSKNSDGVQINMVFLGNLIFQNKFNY